MEQDFLVRKVHLDDVKAIHGLLLTCVRKGLLPRALIYLYGHIRNFFVAETPEGEIVAVAPWLLSGRTWGKSALWWCATICAPRGWGGGWWRPVSMNAANCI